MDPTASIAGSLTFASTDLAELGFDAAEIESGGTLTSEWGPTTLLWTATVVPEPSTYAAIFGYIALGVIAIRRRRN
jgi:hypothetical protein